MKAREKTDRDPFHSFLLVLLVTLPPCLLVSIFYGFSHRRFRLRSSFFQARGKPARASAMARACAASSRGGAVERRVGRQGGGDVLDQGAGHDGILVRAEQVLDAGGPGGEARRGFAPPPAQRPGEGLGRIAGVLGPPAHRVDGLIRVVRVQGAAAALEPLPDAGRQRRQGRAARPRGAWSTPGRTLPTMIAGLPPRSNSAGSRFLRAPGIDPTPPHGSTAPRHVANNRLDPGLARSLHLTWQPPRPRTSDGPSRRIPATRLAPHRSISDTGLRSSRRTRHVPRQPSRRGTRDRPTGGRQLPDVLGLAPVSAGIPGRWRRRDQSLSWLVAQVARESGAGPAGTTRCVAGIAQASKFFTPDLAEDGPRTIGL